MKKILLLFLASASILIPTVYAQEFSISGGRRHGIGVCANGAVYSWGDNAYGQLGRSGPITPFLVPFADNSIKILSADAGSGNYNLAIDCNKNVWAWGQNSDGQLGNGQGGRTASEVNGKTGGASNVGVPVKTLKGEQTTETGADGTEYLADVKYVSAGMNNSYAIVGPTRALMAWGTNIGQNYGMPGQAIVAGLLGNNNPLMNYSNTPVFVRTGNGSILQNVKHVEAHVYGGVAVTTDGKVYSWGYNSNSGILGQAKTFTQLPFSLYAAPVMKGNYSQFSGLSGVTGELTGIAHVAAGDDHVLAVAENGDVYGWGGNYFNQLGLEFVPIAEFATLIAAGQSGGITGKTTRLTNSSIAAASMFGSAVVVNREEAGEKKGYLYTFGLDGVYPELGEQEFNLHGQLGQGKTGATTQSFARVRLADLVDTFKLADNSILRAKDVNVISVSEGAGVFYVFTQDKVSLKTRVFAMGANNKGQLGINGFSAVNYPTEFPAFCELAEPCPVADLGSDKLLCYSSPETIRSKAYRGSSYSYKWTYIDADGGNKDITPASNPYQVFATIPGKYVLEISRNLEGGCNACESAIDTIGVEYEQPTFSDPGDNIFCNWVAPSATVETDSPNGLYAWYASSTSDQILAKTIGNEGATVDLTLTNLKEGDKQLTLWVADSTILNGTFGQKEKLCTIPNVQSAPVEAYSTQITIYEDILLKEFKVSLYNIVEQPTSNPPGGFMTFTSPVTVELCTTREQNGILIPNTVISSFVAQLTYSRRGLYSLVFPVNYNLSGDAEGKNYFLRIKVSSGSNLMGGYSPCTQDYSLLKDNLTSTIAKVSGTVEFNSRYTTYYGYFYDFKFNQNVSTKCERFPVTLTENCTITSLDDKYLTNSISIYPNPATSGLTLTASDFEKAILIDGSGRELKSFQQKNISLDNYVSGLYYLKVQTKTKTEILKVVKQ